MCPSILSLRRGYPLWHQRPISRRRQQRILSSRGRLLPSNRQQRRYLRPSLDSLSLHHDLCAWHIPHSTPFSSPPIKTRAILTNTGRTDLVGSSPRQRNALLRLLLPGQREAQLSRPRHPSRSYSMHLFWRDPARQQNCIHRPCRLLHHPHICILRPGHRTPSVHWSQERSPRPILDGSRGLCRQCYFGGTDHLLQHHVLLP